jgi:2'-5' RNA ligase
MVMAPGGENPRPELSPAMRKVGIRVHNKSNFRKTIDELRNELIEFETKEVLGNRIQSSRSRNAFGSKFFQPHITLLKAGSGIQDDLTEVGNLFRDCVNEITFDKFVIIKKNNF